MNTYPGLNHSIPIPSRDAGVPTFVPRLLAFILAIVALPAYAAGTVGNGTPQSCTEAALNAALVGGGAVFFDCGPAPVTIALTSPKNINIDTVINGAAIGPITLTGNGGVFYLFQVGANTTLELSRLFLQQAGGAVRAMHDSAVIKIWFSEISLHSDPTGVFVGAVVGSEILIGFSTIKRNTYTSSAPGAGVQSVGTGPLTIMHSQIGGNTQHNGGGAGVMIASDNALITHSLIVGNRADNAIGGGVRNDGNDTQIINSTITDNSAAAGSAIVNLGGSLDISFSTIANNVGGAISNQQPGVQLRLDNSIVANNGTNCAGTFLDGGNNLQFGGAVATSCGAGIPVANPLLGALADNGGHTRTMALLPGSPAIDAANNALCPTFDQRLVARPQGPACDIGAFERHGDTIFRDGFE